MPPAAERRYQALMSPVFHFQGPDISDTAATHMRFVRAPMRRVIDGHAAESY